MRYVYILKSPGHADKRYFGITSDLKMPLKYHNSGRCIHTSKFRPWKIDTAIAFSDERRAIAFERYLKTGSGKAFSKKRL